MMRVLIFLLVLYVGGYVGFRLASVETWERDGHQYVIFPKDQVGTALYYLWRPLSYLDDALTGTGAHIGPHLP
jgi:hypothetical protein